MKSRAIILASILFLIVFMGMKFAHAFFSDAAQSTSNTFIASNAFPTSIPTITPIPTSTPTPNPTPTPSGIATHLVISEVQIHGANANQDFVEIYNPTNSSIDLNGWKLRKRTSNGTESSLVLIGSGKTISAHGFFLWANNQSGYDIAVGADVSNSNNISENNSVAVLNPSNNIIDQVAWGNGTNQFIEGTAYPNNPATDQSIERKALSSSTASSMISGGSDELKGNGFDVNENSTDFILRTSSQSQNSSSPTETL